jgi:hypothetical protein
VLTKSVFWYFTSEDFDNQLILYHSPVNSRAIDIDIWTSGTNKGCNDGFVWCSSNKTFIPTEINWKTGHPNIADGCVYINFANKEANESALGVDHCAVEKAFACEVK